ncbi:hypothetical protein FRX31_035011 [Thalictrum thalictroides]|uniref:Uncharacterized protein n=1 Tax=Thalictrum thalictroides TaxID=46969 RepID=A0A7J6UT31_THATH|nr:hypothetical protein FRX31_035011 [Thalictrum thalictroides]
MSPEVQAWYLGDRCIYQTRKVIGIPFPPAQNMRADDLTIAQQTIHRPNSWPSAQMFAIPCDLQAYGQYWRRVSRGSLFTTQVERMGNIDIMRASALRPEVRIPYPVDPTVSQENYPMASHLPPPNERLNLRVVGSQGLDTSVLVPVVDYHRLPDFAPDYFIAISEGELRHRDMNAQYAIERQENAGRIEELEHQVENMRLVIDELEPRRRRRRALGSGRGDNASNQESAPS